MTAKSNASHWKLAFAAPLALALAACDTNEAGGAAAIEGEPVASVPAPEGTEWRDQVTVTDYDGYLLGNPDAPVKVVEYASLTCPACAAFAANGAEELKNDYVNTGKVSFELRNQIHGPHDLILARLARCGSPESFHPLADQIWANLQSLLEPVFSNSEAMNQTLQLPENERFVAFADQAGFYDFFAARGISEADARQCLSDFSAMETIANNSDSQSSEFEVTGTPTFFVNGQKVDTNSWSGLEPILQSAGAR